MREAKDIKKLAKFFDFILAFFDDGIAIMLGAVAAPSIEEIYSIMQPSPPDLGVRVDGGSSTPLAERRLMAIAPIEDILNKAGGWSAIWEATRDYKSVYPEQWKLIEAYALFMRPGGIIRDGKGGMSKIISSDNDNVVPQTLRNRRAKYLYSLAVYIMSYAAGNHWDLISAPRGRQARRDNLY